MKFKLIEAKLLILSTLELCFLCPLDALFPNGSVSVRNAQRVGGPGGKPDALTGYADRPDPKVEGKLVVHLSGVPHGGSCELICRNM